MALVGIELETLVSEPDALTTRPPPCAATSLLPVTNSQFNIVVASVGKYLSALLLSYDQTDEEGTN